MIIENLNRRVNEWLLAQDLKCDPYEHITWPVGTDDDFICFDHAVGNDGKTVLRAVVNSETGAFCEDFALEMVESGIDAVMAAQRILSNARDWASENLAEDGGDESFEDKGDDWIRAICNDLNSAGYPVPDML